MPIRLETVIHVLRRIAPLPEDTLLAGAWVPALYRCQDDHRAHVVVTKDVDFALSTTSGNRYRHQQWVDSLSERLGEDVFELRHQGTSYGSTPFTVLAPRDEGAGLPEIEVIAELRGGGPRPPEISRWFGGSFVPQEVRDLEILFAAPWPIELPVDGTTIGVPNPLAFVAQKALVNRRTRDKDISDATDILEAALCVPAAGDRNGLRASIESHSPRAAQQMETGLARLKRRLLGQGSTLLGEALRALPEPISPREGVELLKTFLADCGVEP